MNLPVFDLEQLAQRVRDAIDQFQIPTAREPSQLGGLLPLGWFEAGLREMSTALVKPHWADAYDSEQGVVRSVAVVADDSDVYLLAFGPTPRDGDFVLVNRQPDGLFISNIRGDAVGCFLAR